MAATEKAHCATWNEELLPLCDMTAALLGSETELRSAA